MMAKIIDRWMGILLLCILGFGAALSWTGNIPLAAALAFSLGMVLNQLSRHWRQTVGARRDAVKGRAALSSRMVMHWALSPDPAAAERFLRSGYAEARPFRFHLVARHPLGRAMDASELIELWRGAQDGEPLVIAVTGPVEASALSLARTLEKPRVRLIPPDALADILARSDLPIEPPPAPPVLTRRERLIRFVPGKKRAPFCALYAVFMLFAYLVIGNLVYLAAALMLIALSAVGFRRKRQAPKTLLD